MKNKGKDASPLTPKLQAPPKATFPLGPKFFFALQKA
jgi:hypothetical protein